MSCPSHDRMHQLVKSEAPRVIDKMGDHLSKAARRVVAVEKHWADWQDDDQTLDERFMWVKGRGVSRSFPSSRLRCLAKRKACADFTSCRTSPWKP